MYVYMRMYVRYCVCMSVCACMFICMCVYVRGSVCLHVCVCRFVSMHMCACWYEFEVVCVCILVCACVHVRGSRLKRLRALNDMQYMYFEPVSRVSACLETITVGVTCPDLETTLVWLCC